MCFRSKSQKKAEESANLASAESRAAAELERQQVVRQRAEQKREDIQGALSQKSVNQGRRGSSGARGRRSLYSANTGAGFISRFD